MRDKLAPYLEKFVLCKGWIEDWSSIDEETTRVYIKNPVIKSPNRNVHFDDLKIISKEHHINLFLKGKHPKLRRLDEIFFTGNVSRYVRSNGTTDYGINPLPTSQLHEEIDFLYDTINEDLSDKSNRLFEPQTLLNYEFKYSQRLVKYEELLEKVGNNLPTFYFTYDQYKKMISVLKKELEERIVFIRSVCSNRKLRRRWKVPSNFAESIPSYKEWSDRTPLFKEWSFSTT